MLFARSLAVLLLLALAGCKSGPSAAPDEDVVEQYPDDLQVEDLRVGTGDEATVGSVITVHYVGRLIDGRVFDSSLERDALSFKLGARKVIKGWDQGLVGMKVGGKRRLTIPPRLGYGSRAVGEIPPNSHLIFEVELFAVTR